ncbi:MAG: hypothetical protein ACXW5U_27135 [Thermoanaerobaculia bacterium]
MKRILVALVAVALLGCGGDEVQFDLDSPPPWLKNLDRALPAKALRQGEISGDCFGVQFSTCEATVAASRSMTRKGTFALVQGREVRITYVPNEKANDVTITLRSDKDATVPVRKSGGTLTFVCNSVDRCMIELR